MPETFNEVIVVEGNRDAAKIKAVFPRADILTTQGAAIDEDTLMRLRELNALRGLILMLDPDYPGERIRRRINDVAGPTKHVFIPKHACIDTRKNKVGIEHASDDTVRQALHDYVHDTTRSAKPIGRRDMAVLGLAGCAQASRRRQVIAEAFKLGMANAKTMRKRLNMFAVTVDQLKAVLQP